MTRFALPLLICLALPAAAQEAEEDWRSLMQRGAEMFLEGLRGEMAPALDDLAGLAEQFGPAMRGFIAEMGPAMADILEQVQDWSVYHPPEMLPNGDIIIRRKVTPDDAPQAPAPEGQIDL